MELPLPTAVVEVVEGEVEAERCQTIHLFQFAGLIGKARTHLLLAEAPVGS